MTSATAKSVWGPQANWTTETYLLANVVDLLQGANWQRGGGKGRKPQPVPRPRNAAEVREQRERMKRMEARHREWQARRHKG